MELIIEYSKRKVPFKMLSEKYGAGIQTVSDLIKNKNRILKFCSDTDSMLGLKHRYTLKTSENPKVDFATNAWFRQERFKGTIISVKHEFRVYLFIWLVG